MAVENKWLKPLAQSAEKINENILEKMPTNAPEVIDYSKTNPLIRAVDIFAHIAEGLYYRLDRKAEEAYLSTCRTFPSAVRFAKMFDYPIRTHHPASVELEFYFENQLTEQVDIPEGTEVQTKSGIPFFTVSDVSILPGQTSGFVSAIQASTVVDTVLGVSDGSAGQQFILPFNAVGDSFIITIAGDTYTKVDTFAFSRVDDRHFKITKNEFNQVELIFGDGFNGILPPSAEIKATYQVCEGVLGKVLENTITEIQSSIIVPSGFVLKARNPNPATGGTDSENLEDLKRRIPLHIRTRRRAVTEEDFIDLAEMVPGVLKAGILYDGEKRVSIYITAVGGIASPELLSEVQEFLDKRRLITTEIVVLATQEIRSLLEMNIRLRGNLPKEIVEEALIENLSNRFNSINQQINGQIFISDIYQEVEKTEGVGSSDLIRFIPVPYARPAIGLDKNLDWTVNLLPTSESINTWRISFIAEDRFQLFKNNLFDGEHETGVEILKDEVSFTVNGSYVAGERWDFTSYRYGRNLELQEPSVPVIRRADITLNFI